MLNKIKNVAKSIIFIAEEDDQPEQNDSPWVGKSAEELIHPYVQILERIRECTNIDDATWDLMYVSMFKSVANYLQLLPASAGHHHSGIGGLLTHTMEISLYAIRASRRIKYTSTGAESEPIYNEQAFRFAVTSSALMHDVGKILTDILVKVEGKNWSPLQGPIPVGKHYEFTWNVGVSNGNRRDHEHSGVLLAKEIIPAPAFEWVRSIDELLYRKWISSLSGHGEDYGGEVYDCVHKADIFSAKQNMQQGLANRSGTTVNQEQNALESQSNISTKQRYFHEPFIIWWSNTLLNNNVKINEPGAFAWVSKEYVFIVAPKGVVQAMDAVRVDKNIPKEVPVVLSKLLELRAIHSFTNDKKNMFKLHVLDPKGLKGKPNWQSELSFIAIYRKLVDPSLVLDEFHGTITNTDDGSILHDAMSSAIQEEVKNGASIDVDGSIAVNPKFIEGSTSEVSSSVELEGERAEPVSDVDSPKTTKKHGFETGSAIDTSNISSLVAATIEAEPAQNSLAKEITPLTTENLRQVESTNDFDSLMASQQQIPIDAYADANYPDDESSFWDWLRGSVSAGGLAVNQPNAPIHIVSIDRGYQAFLVSPAIFIDFLNSEGLPTDKPEIQQVQRSFQAMGLHKPRYGRDIANFHVRKEKRRLKGKPLSGFILSVEATRTLFGDSYNTLSINPNLDTR